MIVSLPAATLLAHLKAALRFASRDDTRPHLACVRIEVHAAEVRFVATDGSRLWVASASMTHPSYQSGVMHLAYADATRLLKVIDRKGGPVTVHSAPDGVVTITQGAQTSTLRALALGHESGRASYPPYHHVIDPIAPMTIDRVATSVNGDYLADAVASFADIYPADVRAKDGSVLQFFQGTNASAPFTIVAPSMSAIACIMPTRDATDYDTASKHAATVIARFKDALLRETDAAIPSRRKSS